MFPLVEAGVITAQAVEQQRLNPPRGRAADRGRRRLAWSAAAVIAARECRGRATRGEHVGEEQLVMADVMQVVHGFGGVPGLAAFSGLCAGLAPAQPAVLLADRLSAPAAGALADGVVAGEHGAGHAQSMAHQASPRQTARAAAHRA